MPDSITLDVSVEEARLIQAALKDRLNNGTDGAEVEPLQELIEYVQTALP